VATLSSPLAVRAGRIFGDARRALGLTQRDVEQRTGIPQSVISRFERGVPCSVDLTRVDRIGSALGGRVGLSFEAPFLADRVMQRDRVHARCVAYIAARLRADGWLVATEVEIEGGGGPGWIDVLAFDPGSGWLLVIEMKTEIHDFGRVQRTLAWYERRAVAAARTQGWRSWRTHAALLLLSTDAVDRALAINRALAGEAFPGRARHLAPFVASPGVAPAPAGRSLAVIDPFSRRRLWLRPTRLDGRRTMAPHADYAAVVRRLEGRRARP